MEAFLPISAGAFCLDPSSPNPYSEMPLLPCTPPWVHALLPAPCTPHPGSHSSCRYPQCSSHVSCTRGMGSAPCTADGLRGSCADIWVTSSNGSGPNGFSSSNGKKQAMETNS